MELKNYLKRSIRSLMLHRLRSLLSTLGILFGVTAVVAMLSIGEGAKQETLDQIEQLGMNIIIIKQMALSETQQQHARENRSRGLSQEDAFYLQKIIPSLLMQAPVKIIKASLPNMLQNMTPEILAVSGAYNTIKSLKLSEGRFICDDDQHNKNLVCILGSDIAKALGQSGHIGKSIRIENSLFKIVGILQSSHWKPSKNTFLATKNLNHAIFIPLGSENVLRLFSHPENDMLSEIILKIKNNSSLTHTADIIKTVLNRLHGDYKDFQIIIPQELLNQANQTQRTFNQVLGSIAAISLLVGGIGIMNMMLANITARTREIGIRRALGARRMDILIQFLVETLLLTLIGAILGVIVGILFSFIIGYFAEWKTIVTAWSLLLSLGMAAVVGVFSGLYPAYQASILHPIQALRNE